MTRGVSSAIPRQALAEEAGRDRFHRLDECASCGAYFTNFHLLVSMLFAISGLYDFQG
jgi:hypothetical protein